MPPKAKFTREEVVKAALDIVRAEGPEALTSRALGARLGSSARPVFTVFQSMEEVQQAVAAAAKQLYRGYVERGLSEVPAFKGVGMQYILFAIDEPKLFQLLFMTERVERPDLSSVLPVIDESYEQILMSIRDGYGMDRRRAERLYRHLWIYTHGIAALCVTGMCRFTGGEISEMLTEVFTGLLDKMKGCENDD